MSQRIYGSRIVKVVKQRCQPHLSFFGNKLITIILFQPPKGLENPQMSAQYSAAVTSTNQKVSTFRFLGCDVERKELDAEISSSQFAKVLKDAASNPNSIGIIVQNPIPQHKLRSRLELIPPSLDIDGINPNSIFQASATSEAISRLVSEFAEAGDRVAVVGSRGFVGSGVVRLLQSRNIKTIELDRATGNTDAQIKESVLSADLVVSATGKANLIQSDHLKTSHKLVVDAGFIPQADGTVLGDIGKNAYDIPEYLTPVPGGVGPTQMAVLLERIMSVAQVSIQPWNYHRDVLEPLKAEKAAKISYSYSDYAASVADEGLAGAKKIAKNALRAGIEPKQVTEMLLTLPPLQRQLNGGFLLHRLPTRSNSVSCKTPVASSPQAISVLTGCPTALRPRCSSTKQLAKSLGISAPQYWHL